MPAGETLALGLDGPFPAPVVRLISSPRQLALAFQGAPPAHGGPPLSELAPALLVALGPPARRRAVQVQSVVRQGDLVRVRYRVIPQARLPRELLLDAEERWLSGSLDAERTSAYHLVRLPGLPLQARLRFEREQERAVMGWVELEQGLVVFQEDPLLSPISGPGDRLEIRHGPFMAEVPLAWSGARGVPVQMLPTPPGGRGRFLVRDARAAAALTPYRGRLMRVDAVVRRHGQPELLPERAWLIDGGLQVYGPTPNAPAAAAG